ncbi:MAG: T9SS type A sorting domain-containing protein [Taibaiella sp.]|nr:T9SS type A sorting domain-containing protein [Taibaiella sp.]
MDDIDGDGDIDIIAYDVWGTTITMYQNCTKEDNLHADSIKICLKDWCWGRTIQNYERKQVLGYSCPWSIPTCKGCGPGGKGTHGSNTLLLMDMDNDGDLDWFNGNESFSDIQYFVNGKAEFGVDSAIAEDTIWSANGVPMNVDMYPGAYALDVNHNGVRDLLFTPMNRQSANYNSIVLYENTGTEANKNFVYKSNTYLIDKMIDIGQGSYPVFYDYDKDGKKDLFIGSEGYYQQSGNYNRSKISYYKNITTSPGNYSFELITDDFMGLWSKNYKGASLAMGDLDNDTLDDLIIGHVDGTFSFYKNTATSNTVTPNWTLVSDTLIDLSTFSIMDVGDYATPAIYDINGDGKNDLISGNQFGGLVYFRNYSTTPGSIGLTKVTDSLGGIKLNSPVDPYSYTAPYVGPTDNTGKDYLVIGTNWGSLYRYDGFQSGANPAKYTMIDSSYSYIRGHKRIAPAFANLDADNTNLHELVLGNVLGGLIFYKQDFKVGITEKVAGNTDVLVYPNPADKILNINWGKDFNEGGVDVQLISVTGQVILSQSYDAMQLSCSLDISGLSAGMYYCIVQSGPNRSVQPVTILK